MTPKYGWWRLHSTNSSHSHPPDCLLDPSNNKKAEPTCAFVKCLYPHACHGSPNPNVYELVNLQRELVDAAPANTYRNETCDESNGYSNDCVDQHNNHVRCRLCATCIGHGTDRYKRTGSGTKCKLCPDPKMNKLLLGIGFIVMIIGSGVMVYMEITSETSEDETSDAIKKIIVNFLQMISLAGGLPLQWPEPMEAMFDTFATLSSAGTTLMIPDCELTDMKTYEAFYFKQIAYTFAPFMVVILCILAWLCLYCCCKSRLKLNGIKLKDYTILSIVLMLFLCYPMLVRLSLSMLKCPLIDNTPYLMADLQEQCFTGRHSDHMYLLTIPQLILYIIGLPLLAAMIILRNKHKLHKKRFYTRFGLLYMGYRPGREWWELVIAVRKVCIVAIGTFGTFVGVVDLQAFVALFIVFLSIIVHLVGQPFNVEKANGKRLHQLEFKALCVCWFTFWGGLLFFLGHENLDTIDKHILMSTTIILVTLNSTFLLYSAHVFVREYLHDRKAARIRKTTRLHQLNSKVVKELSKIVPINDSTSSSLHDVKPDTYSDNDEHTEEHNQPTRIMLIGLKSTQFNGRTGTRMNFIKSGDAIGRYHVILDGNERPKKGNFWPINLQLVDEHNRKLEATTLAGSLSGLHPIDDHFQHHREAKNIHDNYDMSEKQLKKKHNARQAKSRRQTNLRIIARNKLKSSKAMKKVPMFQHLSDSTISTLVDKCQFKRWSEGDVVCNQGDVADRMYIIAVGECRVLLKASDVAAEQERSGNEGENGGGGGGSKETAALKEVCQLHELDFFGESSLKGLGSNGTEGDVSIMTWSKQQERVRNATIVVLSPMMDTMSLSRDTFRALLTSGDLDNSVVKKVADVGHQRKEANLRSMSLYSGGGGSGGARVAPPTPLGRPKGLPATVQKEPDCDFV